MTDTLTSNELCKVCEGLCCGEIPRLRKQIEILQHANRFLSEQIPSAHETLPVERSAVSDARLQTMIDKTSGRDRHAALLELQRWRRAHELKAKVVPSICGKPMPDGKGAGQCINPPGHEGDCDDMPF